jgi:hypothetical protein
METDFKITIYYHESFWYGKGWCACIQEIHGKSILGETDPYDTKIEALEAAETLIALILAR